MLAFPKEWSGFHAISCYPYWCISGQKQVCSPWGAGNTEKWLMFGWLMKADVVAIIVGRSKPSAPTATFTVGQGPAGAARGRHFPAPGVATPLLALSFPETRLPNQYTEAGPQFKTLRTTTPQWLEQSHNNFPLSFLHALLGETDLQGVTVLIAYEAPQLSEEARNLLVHCRATRRKRIAIAAPGSTTMAVERPCLP